VWPQIVVDFIVMSLAISMVPAWLGEGAIRSARAMPSLSPLALAAMISVIFLFSGAYPRYPSPVGIADTEGLVRGMGCAALLLTIVVIATRTRPLNSVLLAAAFAFALLAAERECWNIVRPRGMVGTSDLNGLNDRQSGLVLYRQDPSALLVKRLGDIVGAATFLIAALPLMAAVSLLIKIDSRGPALIRQRRIGNNGVPFYMWKFRSMHANVARYARSPVSDTDPRLTSLGRALRRFSIDEIPQLINVLMGDMSLVGPRPEMPFIVKTYDARQRLRLHARPGITGLWQVSPARARPIHESVELDLYYIQNRNIFLDLAILLRTVTAVVRGIGAA